MRRCGQLRDEGLECLEIGRHAFEDEVDLAGQHPAFAHQRLGAHEILERLEVGIGLARQVHHGEDGHLVAEELLVEQRTIAFDVASLLECAHPAQTGRSRDADPARKLDVGDAPIFLQLFENLLVNGIETGGQGKDSGRFAKCSRP